MRPSVFAILTALLCGCASSDGVPPPAGPTPASASPMPSPAEIDIDDYDTPSTADRMIHNLRITCEAVAQDQIAMDNCRRIQ
jgi:hypothetical protein